VSERTSTRICEAAERLGLTHLPGKAADFAARVEAGLREQRRRRNVLKLSSPPHHNNLVDFD